MLYPKNENVKLDMELFNQPTAEYRGAPFWSWNCLLREDQLLRQVDAFKEMGMGGFHIHARNGLATEYMGEEFLRLVKASHDRGVQNEMLTWLYDEDRYPSGTAGGLVTAGRSDLAMKYLLFTPYAYGEVPKEKRVTYSLERCKENGKLLGHWAVKLNRDGYLVSYKRLGDGEKADNGAVLYHAYMEAVAPDTRFNGFQSANVMDKRAVGRFLEFTHERYNQCLGEHFGKTVPGIFTDEPHFFAKGKMSFARPGEDVATTFTDDFCETFELAYGYDLMDRLPEIFWEWEDGHLSDARWHFNDHCAERFTEAYCNRIGAWCDAHGIMFTGHLMSEHFLIGQTYAMSEAMRNYPAFALPGIDVLSDYREFTTAKQAQSIVRQLGRQGMLSELYGVTDWMFDFRGHKLQGDWQAALGVTVRVHHLAWVSMEGEAKRDYPAAIGYQSPWYKEYKLVEDYYARLNTALTRGKALCRLAVIHPIESFWLRFGPQEHTGEERQQREDNFQNLADWLVYGHLDYDYICESLLTGMLEAAREGESALRVGQMAYDAVLVPDCITLRETTVEALEKFAAAGGRLVFAGQVPTHVNALPSDRVQKLAAGATVVQYNPVAIIRALEPVRLVEIVSLKTAMRAQKLLYQLRQDGAGRWLFVCHGDVPANADIPKADEIEIRTAGLWHVTHYDALAGEIRDIAYFHRDGMTVIPRTFYEHDSILVRLEPAAELKGKPEPPVVKQLRPVEVPLEVPVTLDEPNVMILDWAAFSVDGRAFEGEDEVLRIDAEIRKRFNLESRGGKLIQPYAVKIDKTYEHEITFRFKVVSCIAAKGVKLALEHAADCRIVLNGAQVPSAVEGYFADEDIHTVPLPPIEKGENTLEITVPVGHRIGAEAFYLLGDFGVDVKGAQAEITEPVRRLHFGDYVHQGLPFYGGNVTYHLMVETKGDFTIAAAHFRNSVLSVDVDGERAGVIAWSPYRLAVHAAAGEHKVDITAYGNRYNTFGAIHNADKNYYFPGNPSSWRTTGSAWSREYCLRPTGITVAPIIEAE